MYIVIKETDWIEGFMYIVIKDTDWIEGFMYNVMKETDCIEGLMYTVFIDRLTPRLTPPIPSPAWVAKCWWSL